MAGGCVKIGIVGAEAAKFTPETEAKAKGLIHNILYSAYHEFLSELSVVSGRCHLGGIDIWAEEGADIFNATKEIYPPKVLNWENGYKPRNIQIAHASDVVHNIVVMQYPAEYTGVKYKGCYHCDKRQIYVPPTHCKSGGCWTAWFAKEKLGKPAYWHVI